jgi:hypothetical protein
VCSADAINMLGGGVRAYASVEAGRQEQESSLAAEQMARAQADAANRRGEFEAAKIRREGRRLIGRQIAVAAATGADPGSGSALANQVGAARITESDALTARNNAFLEASGYAQLAKNYQKQARGAKYAGLFTGAGHLLSAYGTVYESKPKESPHLFGGG